MPHGSIVTTDVFRDELPDLSDNGDVLDADQITDDVVKVFNNTGYNKARHEELQISYETEHYLTEDGLNGTHKPMVIQHDVDERGVKLLIKCTGSDQPQQSPAQEVVQVERFDSSVIFSIDAEGDIKVRNVEASGIVQGNAYTINNGWGFKTKSLTPAAFTVDLDSADKWDVNYSDGDLDFDDSDNGYGCTSVPNINTPTYVRADLTFLNNGDKIHEVHLFFDRRDGNDDGNPDGRISGKLYQKSKTGQLKLAYGMQDTGTGAQDLPLAAAFEGALPHEVNDEYGYYLLIILNNWYSATDIKLQLVQIVYERQFA